MIKRILASLVVSCSISLCLTFLTATTYLLINKLWGSVYSFGFASTSDMSQRDLPSAEVLFFQSLNVWILSRNSYAIGILFAAIFTVIPWLLVALLSAGDIWNSRHV